MRRALLCVVLAALLPAASLYCQTAADADALFESAAGHFNAGSYAEAARLLRQAAAIDSALGPDRRADLGFDLKFLGIALSETGKPGEALEALAGAADAFAAAGGWAEQVEALTRIGLLHYSAGRYANAETRFQSALGIVRARRLAGQAAAILNNLGLVYAAWGRYDEALASYTAAREDHLARGDRAAAASNLGNIAGIHLSRGGYDEAERSYLQALEEFRGLGDAANAAGTLVNLGMTASARGAYDVAQEWLGQGLAAAQAAGLGSTEAYARGTLGSVLYATGRYDEAQAELERALAAFSRMGMRLNVCQVTASLGMVFQAWGRQDRALEMYRRSLSVAREIGAPDQVLSSLRFIGSVLQAQEQDAEAIARYTEALTIADSLGRDGDRVILLDALGSACLQSRDVERAEGYFQEALALADRIGKRDEKARVLIHLAGAMQVAGRLADARRVGEEALALCRAAGMRAEEATALNNLGTVLLQQGEPGAAIPWLRQAVAIKEELRRTAPQASRHEFLGAWISSYRWLLDAYRAAGDAAAVLEAAELVKARTLAEQMRARGPGGNADAGAVPPAASLQRALGPRAAILSFANVSWTAPSVVCVTRRAVTCRLLGPESPEPGAGQAELPVLPLETMILAYRSLLLQPRPTAEQAGLRRRMGQDLYELLLAPLETDLEGIDELVIVPDSSLASLPFEALPLPDGRWLAESFHVTYLPSLAVRAIIEARGPSSADRPLLALGGARTAGQQAAPAPRVSEAQRAALRGEAARRLEKGAPAVELYEALGLARWPDLPGTLAEARQLGQAVPGADVLTGSQVTEQAVKRMSADGSLARYRALHFATHGVMVPGVPELSALVLSEAGARGAAEDGYLTMGEVSRLAIAADFVGLSACETGLGRLYEGEGVAGLAQAFLLAGARGLAVSLWQVADDSTRAFMVDLYGLARGKGLSWARAMTEVRRRFIASPAWKEPFFWAPFVYYGP